MRGDVIRGSKTLKKGDGRNSFIKTLEGTALGMQETFLRSMLAGGFCNRGFPLSRLGGPTVRFYLKIMQSLAGCGSASF